MIDWMMSRRRRYENVCLFSQDRIRPIPNHSIYLSTVSTLLSTVQSALQQQQQL